MPQLHLDLQTTQSVPVSKNRLVSEAVVTAVVEAVVLEVIVLVSNLLCYNESYLTEALR